MSTDTLPDTILLANRKHHERFRLADIVLVPEENYRWGSQEGMEADLARLDVNNEDGTKRSSYQDLCASIGTIGVQEPVGLVEREDGFHVIYGFTRVMASRSLNLTHIPVYVYDSAIPEAEVELLQVRENSLSLRREVNWVCEAERYSNLVAAELDRRTKLADGKMTSAETKSAAAAAKATVSKVLGRHPSRLRSAEHFLRILDKRVVDLARKGYLSYGAAQEFHSGDVTKLFPATFITSVLRHLHGRDGYPFPITPDRIRQAKKAVKVLQDQGEEAAGGADVGEESEDAPEVRGASASMASRSLRAAVDAKDDKKVQQGAVALQRGAEKIRQSTASLRDLSDLVAWDAIDAAGLTIASDPKAGERLIGAAAWQRVVGIGYGAGDITAPPFLERLVGGRSEEDEDVERMQRQHDLTSERYVTSAFVRGFLCVALKQAGVRNIDIDDKSWMSKSSPGDGGVAIRHRALFADAVKDAVAMPGRVTLVDRARAAWARIVPFVKPAKK